MKVESQDLWGRMWGPKPPQKSNKLIINNKYGCYGGAFRQIGSSIRSLKMVLSDKPVHASKGCSQLDMPNYQQRLMGNYVLFVYFAPAEGSVNWF